MSNKPGLTHGSETLAFKLADLQRAANLLIRTQPDNVVLFRLWRDVLRLAADNPALMLLKQALLRTTWVSQLSDTQLTDGSWGRFHSQDSYTKTTFRTTEEAIQRALALGLDLGDAVLQRIKQYILDALAGRVALRDPPERNERWPLAVQLILAGRLAQLDPSNARLEPHWQYWVTVAQRAFTSGEYRLADEAAAYPALSGIQAPQGFLESQYALWILTSRSLPAELDQALAGWIWEKPDGIRYIRVGLQQPDPRQIGAWFRSLEILTRFASWRSVSLTALNQIWARRNQQGLWDFGGKAVTSIEFPLSNSWRKPGSRQADHSTWVLSLLRKVFD